MSFFLILAFLFAPPVRASECFKLQNPLPSGFCIDRPTPVINADVIYYFHGAGFDEHIWDDEYYYTKQIREYWQGHNRPAPTVVAISLGQLWLVTPFNLEQFTLGILPHIEARLGGLKGRRILLGESMGGFNVLHLGLRTPLFAKVAAICTPLYDGLTPFSTTSEIRSYLEKTRAWDANKHQQMIDSTKWFLGLMRQHYPARTDRSGPIELVRMLQAPSKTAFYLSAGAHDLYGNYEGHLSLITELQAKRTQVQWRPQWGGHCVMDIPSLAEFLLN